MLSVADCIRSVAAMRSGSQEAKKKWWMEKVELQIVRAHMPTDEQQKTGKTTIES